MKIDLTLPPPDIAMVERDHAATLRNARRLARATRWLRWVGCSLFVLALALRFSTDLPLGPLLGAMFFGLLFANIGTATEAAAQDTFDASALRAPVARDCCPVIICCCARDPVIDAYRRAVVAQHREITGAELKAMASRVAELDAIERASDERMRAACAEVYAG